MFTRFRLLSRPFRFSSLQNLDFQSFHPILNSSKNADTLEFKLVLPNQEGKPLFFDLSKTHTIQDLFNKLLESLSFKSLKAYALDKAELSPLTSFSSLSSPNFFILADSTHLFRLVSAQTDPKSSVSSSEIEKYCEDLDISHLHKRVICNYLNRVDTLNNLSFGFKVLSGEAKPNELVDKDEFITNLIEGLLINRTNLVTDEKALQRKYFGLKAEVESLKDQRKQLDNFVKNLDFS